MRFVNTFFSKIRKKFLKEAKSLLRKGIFGDRSSSATFQNIQKHYDKRSKNLPAILLHKKNDKKSYKIDIYKIAAVVYNNSPE